MAAATVVVTLSIDGTRCPWDGWARRKTLVHRDVANLLERGRIANILCVVDAKGPQSVDVLGDLAVIRCQLHKLRNLRSYLPKSRRGNEGSVQMRADKARKRLQALVSWLEHGCEAAGSRRDGRDPRSLYPSYFANLWPDKRIAAPSADPRWKSPSMIRRWTALGVVTAEKKFYRSMGALVHALRSKQDR